MVVGGGGGQYRLPNGRAPGNATRSARHLGSNIVQSGVEGRWKRGVVCLQRDAVTLGANRMR